LAAETVKTTGEVTVIETPAISKKAEPTAAVVEPAKKTEVKE